MKGATTNKVYKLLTIKEIKNLSSIVLKRELDYLYNDACNIDYVLNPLESEIIHKNITLIESIIMFKEY